MLLTSAQNPLLKSVRRAAAAGRPTENGLVVAEGPHLLREALRSSWEVVQIFCTDAAWEKHSEVLTKTRAEILTVSSRALQSTAAAEASQEVISLLRPREWSWSDLLSGQSLVLVLDGIQDPGNAGTIIRSAEAFGASGAVFLQGSARVANGKLLRASAGSIFRLPHLESFGADDLLTRAAGAGLSLFSLDARRSLAVSEVNLRQPCALVVGSEGSGVRLEILQASTAISIPTRKVESLNAAVACSIALFEASGQRSRA